MIKAIETLYRGNRFRSRLEARYAVFFDTLGIAWEYEKQGYDLNGVRYLPDFWLPEHKYWIEVKGAEATSEEREKAFLLAKLSGHSCYILHSLPAYDVLVSANDLEDISPQIFGYCGGNHGTWGDIHDCMLYCAWAECPACHKIRIHSLGYSNGEECCQAYRDVRPNTPRLIAAYTAARQARFEHGEMPHWLALRSYVPHVVPFAVQAQQTVVTRPTMSTRFQEGDWMQHHLYGKGIVLQIEIEGQKEYVMVQFSDKHGIKRLIMDHIESKKRSTQEVSHGQ